MPGFMAARAHREISLHGQSAVRRAHPPIMAAIAAALLLPPVVLVLLRQPAVMADTAAVLRRADLRVAAVRTVAAALRIRPAADSAGVLLRAQAEGEALRTVAVVVVVLTTRIGLSWWFAGIKGLLRMTKWPLLF
jgi:hypothetical protein